MQGSSSVPEAGARCLAFLNAVTLILVYNFLKYPEKLQNKARAVQDCYQIGLSVASWMHQPFLNYNLNTSG